MSEADKARYHLEREVASLIDEAICDQGGLQGIRVGRDLFEMEEAEDAGDPFVFVRQSDGKRFEIEFDVMVRELPPEPEPPDLDAPVHIEGQEEIPLGIVGAQ